jgi:hypothetical protein
VFTPGQEGFSRSATFFFQLDIAPENVLIKELANGRPILEGCAILLHSFQNPKLGLDDLFLQDPSNFCRFPPDAFKRWLQNGAVPGFLRSGTCICPWHDAVRRGPPWGIPKFGICIPSEILPL